MSTTFEPGRVHQVPLDAIAPDPDQPRTTFPEKPLRELAENIKARGVLHPITARIDEDGSLLIKSGERRWRAARLAGLETVPVLISIDGEPDSDRLVDQIVENELREALSPLELAAALAKLRGQGMSPPQIRKHLQTHGLDYARSTISNMLRLLELPEWAKTEVEAGKLGAAHAREILRAKAHPGGLDQIHEGYKDHLQWKDSTTVEDMRVIVENAAHAAGRALDGSSVSGRAKFDWRNVCKGCEHLLEIGRHHFCMNPSEFDRRQAEADVAGEKASSPAAAKPETDPSKVKPRKLKENEQGIVKLKGLHYDSFKRLAHADFDVAANCVDCPHKHRGSHDGVADAEDVCFYPPCFEKLELQVRKDEARAVPIGRPSQAMGRIGPSL